MRSCCSDGRALARIIRGCAWGTAVLVACSRDVTGPSSGVRAFQLAPVFPQWFQQVPDAYALAPFTRIRAMLTDASGAAVADTTVAFPASADSVALQFNVPASASSGSEALHALVWCMDAAGDTLFKGGPVSVAPSES